MVRARSSSIKSDELSAQKESCEASSVELSVVIPLLQGC